jgi:hypothetical protein
MLRNSVPILLAPMLICLSATAQFLDRPIDRMDSLGNLEKRGVGTYAMVELQAIHAGDHVPFWMRSLQYGSLPLNGTSVSAIATFVRNYEIGKPKKLDWGGGLQLRTNIGGQDPTLLTEDENKAIRTQALLTEAYLKVRSGKFEFKAGRFRQVLGLSDTTLGMGNFTESGNSLPVPMIQIGLPDYSFPIFDSLFSFKGTFSQGWMGDTRTEYDNNSQTLPEFLHQKSLHMRIGKPGSSVKGIVGLVHKVLWVDNKKLFGESNWDLSPLQTYLYIVAAKDYKYKPGSSETTTVGNNLGQFDLGIEIRGRNSDVMLYRQFFYDHRLSSDGITGVSIRNSRPSNGSMHLVKLVFEYMSTMNQGYDNSQGEPVFDNYYNHEWLYDGVSYKGAGIGNPFISPKSTIRSSFPASGPTIITFSNTRVRAFNVGVEWRLSKAFLRNRFSFSKNFGSYYTENTFPPSGQFSMSMEAGVPLRKGWQARAMFALDSGELLYNTAGGFLSVARIF